MCRIHEMEMVRYCDAGILVHEETMVTSNCRGRCPLLQIKLPLRYVRMEGNFMGNVSTTKNRLFELVGYSFRCFSSMGHFLFTIQIFLSCVKDYM